MQRMGFMRSVGIGAGTCRALLVIGCGDGEPTGLGSSAESPGVTTVELPSQLPICNVLRRHEVFYVSSQQQFYVCEGGQMQPIEVGGDSGVSLVRVTDEPPGETC